MSKAGKKNIADKLRENEGFPSFVLVEERNTIADLYKPVRRTGIYILKFLNNEYYIGQAVDVVKRFLQHKKVHEDIIGISFKRMSIKVLDFEEKRLIELFESNNVLLRNISLTSIPKGDSDFDLFVTLIEQQKWLQGRSINDIANRRIDEVQRRKYKKKFQKLIADEIFEKEVLSFYQKYVSKCIIQPIKTEFFYWSVSCLPGETQGRRFYSLLSIYWQEVLQIWLNKFSGKVTFQIRLAKSPFSSPEKLIKRLRVKSPSAGYEFHHYETGGPDQFAILVDGSKEAISVLADKEVVGAIRLLNLRLMKKGVCVPRRFHCYDLASLLVQ